MTKVHAKVKISCAGDQVTPIEYYWTATILGVECSKPMVDYKTAAVAERTARKWCHRLGIPCTVTVDKGIRT